MRTFSSCGPVDRDLHYHAPGQNLLKKHTGRLAVKTRKKAVIISPSVPASGREKSGKIWMKNAASEWKPCLCPQGTDRKGKPEEE